jgi:uncharacterized protein (DUF983 family)
MREDEEKVWQSKGTTVGKAVPEGPKRPCPKCGSTKLRLLTKDEEVAAFYNSFKVHQPMFTLSPPRECKSCGHRWEVTPSTFILLLALFVLAVGFILGAVGAVGLSLMMLETADDPENKGSANDYIKGAGFAVLSAGFATGCAFGFRYYLAKLRKKQTSEAGDQKSE